MQDILEEIWECQPIISAYIFFRKTALKWKEMDWEESLIFSAPLPSLDMPMPRFNLIIICAKRWKIHHNKADVPVPLPIIR